MQNPTPNILLFSRPVRSGKTTELFRFVRDRKDAGGVLTPDREGRRFLYDIAASAWHPFEVDEKFKEPLVSIGRFRFAQAAFQTAKKLFAAHRSYCLFIVDEVGKLEIGRGEGFAPELDELIADYASRRREGILLLVVRDTLLQAAVNMYGLHQAKVIHSLSSLHSLF